MKNVLKVLTILFLGSSLVLNASAHGERDSEKGGDGQGGEAAEQTGTYTLSETYDHVINGMRLIIAYDSRVDAFVSTVENTLTKTLYDVRVEVHQSNGMELGPTPRTDLRPGQKIPVRLDAVGTFDTWTAHPETGTESGHGSGEGYGEHGSEGYGEHGSEHSGEHGSEGFRESHRSGDRG